LCKMPYIQRAKEVYRRRLGDRGTTGVSAMNEIARLIEQLRRAEYRGDHAAAVMLRTRIARLGIEARAKARAEMQA